MLYAENGACIWSDTKSCLHVWVSKTKTNKQTNKKQKKHSKSYPELSRVKPSDLMSWYEVFE